MQIVFEGALADVCRTDLGGVGGHGRARGQRDGGRGSTDGETEVTFHERARYRATRPEVRPISLARVARLLSSALVSRRPTVSGAKPMHNVGFASILVL